MSLDDVGVELDRARRRARLFELLDELDIIGRPRAAMIDDDERALAILEGARRARGVRNAAALAIALFRRPDPPKPEPEPELVDAPPSLAAIEHAWAHGEDVQAMVLPLMVRALERHGGLGPLRAQINHDGRAEIERALDRLTP